MVDIFRDKLDMIMGKNRNCPLEFHGPLEKYNDPEVCKYFLITVCPLGLFPNTRYESGGCNKRHDNLFIEQFHNDLSLKWFKLEKMYIENALKYLWEKIVIVDNKVKKIHSQQDIPLYKGEIPPEFQEKIQVVETKIKKLIEEMQFFGEQGDLEKVEELNN